MKKYLPGIILGTISLIIVVILFTYLDRQPEKTVGDSEGDENMLALTLSDDGSFYTVTGLGSYQGSDVVIPSEYKGIPIREIGVHAFWFMSEMTSVTIPDTVETIREAAFRGTSITGITVPDSVKTIEGYVFSDCKMLRNAVLPKSVVSLGEHIFEGCGALTEINLPENLKEIPASMFAHCTSLSSIRLPDGLENIGAYAFQDCNALKHIDLPKSLRTVSDSAFRMARLEEITLPDGIKELGVNAFSGNPIAEIKLPEGLEKIGNMAFLHTKIEDVYIPASVTEIGYEPFSAGHRGSDDEGEINLSISEDNPIYYSKNGCIIARENGELIFAPSPERVPTDGMIKIIGPFAYGNTDADVVRIPEGVTEIRGLAVANYVRIDEIILPASLERMERGAISALSMSSEAVGRISFSGTHEQWERMDRDEEWLSETEKVTVVDLTN